MDTSQQPGQGLLGRGTPFVGRDGELSQLRRNLDWCDRPRGRVVQVTGDPGIGRSRLLSEFAVLAQAAGVPMLRGQATEFERQVPFGVFINALDDHVSGLPAGVWPDLV